MVRFYCCAKNVYIYMCSENTHRVGSASGGGGEIDEEPGVALGSKVRQVISFLKILIGIFVQVPSFGDILDASHEVIENQVVDPVEGESVPKSPFHGMPNSVEKIESDSKRRHQPATEHSNCGVDCDFDANVSFLNTETLCRLKLENL